MIEGECPKATALLDNYTRATAEYFEAADDLSNIEGLHDKFIATKQHTEQAHEKCRLARLALTNHYLEHDCRFVELK
jgi:hypothetical protein